MLVMLIGRYSMPSFPALAACYFNQVGLYHRLQAGIKLFLGKSCTPQNDTKQNAGCSCISDDRHARRVRQKIPGALAIRRSE